MASNLVKGVVSSAEHAVDWDAGHRALSYFDDILAKEPYADADLFSHCTRELSELRNELTARSRKPGADDAVRTGLAHVNAIISVVLAGHFPLGPVPWKQLHKARDWLVLAIGSAK